METSSERRVFVQPRVAASWVPTEVTLISCPASDVTRRRRRSLRALLSMAVTLAVAARMGQWIGPRSGHAMIAMRSRAASSSGTGASSPYQSVWAKSPTTDSRTESQYRALTGATVGATEARL